MMLNIFEVPMPGDIKGALTTEEVVGSTVQSFFVLFFEVRECGFVVRPELKVFSSKSTQTTRLTNVVEGVLSEIEHANFTSRKHPKSTGITPSILVAKENCGSDPGRDFIKQGAVLHPSFV